MGAQNFLLPLKLLIIVDFQLKHYAFVKKNFSTTRNFLTQENLMGVEHFNATCLGFGRHRPKRPAVGLTLPFRCRQKRSWRWCWPPRPGLIGPGRRRMSASAHGEVLSPTCPRVRPPSSPRFYSVLHTATLHVLTEAQRVKS